MTARGAGGSNAWVFLDRDGTLCRDDGYTHRVEDYERLPGVIEGLSALRDAGFRFAVVTNQSGIGRGYYGEPAFERFMAHLLADLAAHDIAIEATFHCPHLPDAGCGCRKPDAAMLERARDVLGADLSRSWVIGDRSGDIGLAERAGCAGAVLVLTGYGEKAAREISPDVPRAADLVEAARTILAARQASGVVGRQTPDPR